MSDPVLSIRGVRKDFGTTTVLRGIDLDVHANEAICLIGASGSGKSTLLRCVNLLEQVTDGVILLDGEDITDPRVDADAVRRRIGVVFQAYNLFPHMSVLRNVALAPRVVAGVPKAAAEERARELLARVGLADKADDYPDRLSGGQQQRTAIARAIANDPRLLLLDEVTSALDPELVGEVLDLVGELKAQGMTIVMATHEMGFARRVADRVCFLDGGVIAESGPPEQVIDAPTHPRTQQFLSRVFAPGHP
ncbi:MAG TPA: amino acid ABC transporter ATP-binding protein [Mycobacteriales bacterium]|nr:amino acid ABC transporter ATP-binding protein [Mycobacteriales bacterium]